MTITTNHRALWAGLLLCTTGIATVTQASTLVTFSVDMSAQVANATFTNGISTVAVRGTFDGWSNGGLPLVQQGSSSVYTNTINNSTDADGAVMSYIFLMNGGTYETTADFHNRAVVLPSASGTSLVLPTSFFSDAGSHIDNNVTFQVDMSQQINIGAFTNDESVVEVRGNFNSWSGGVGVLTRDPSILRTNQYGLVTSNVYTGTFLVSASTNAAMDYKFVQNNNYEGGIILKNSDGNRFFTHNLEQTLPIVYYGDAAYAPLAQVTFNVDMSVVALTDTNFNSASVTINGDVMGWGGVAMTNNPSAPNTNIYSAVFTIGQGAAVNYQYRYTQLSSGNTIYDHADGANGGNNNRYYVVPNAPVVNVPPVYFNDASLSDYLQNGTAVSFRVDMNGAVGTDGHVFDRGSDLVYINGQFANWYAWWGGANPVAAPAEYLLQEDPAGSGIYSNTIIIPSGTAISFNYKYGIAIGGAPGPNDNEAGFGQNHYRVVRSTAFNPYPMPLDKFGTMYAEPFFSRNSRSGANLSIGAASGGNIPVSWLGRPGAHLQVSTNLSGVWQNLYNTDGTNWTAGFQSTNGFVSVTNVPASGQKFFRLTNP